MAIVQTGRGTVFGFAGSISFSGYVNLYLNSGDFMDEFTLKELRDGTNELKGHIASGRVWRAHLIFVPVATTGSNTLATALTSLAPPEPLSVVTLSDFSYAALNTNWSYAGGWKVGFSREDLATYELDIVTNPDTDITTIIT